MEPLVIRGASLMEQIALSITVGSGMMHARLRLRERSEALPLGDRLR
jgi:hypothetical protein